MKKSLILGTTLLVWQLTWSQSQSDVRHLLVAQLKATHTEEDWFVPINVAVKNLTEEQAEWSDGSDNHSIAGLVAHLVFWNERVMKAFKGDSLPDFTQPNEITFDQKRERPWPFMAKKLDSLQSEWIRLVQQAPVDRLEEWDQTILNLCAHMGYHTGQIIYIRKRKGWWK